MNAKNEADEAANRNSCNTIPRTRTPCSVDIDGNRAKVMSCEDWLALGALHHEASKIVSVVQALNAHGKSRQREKWAMLCALKDSDNVVEAVHLLRDAPPHLQADRDVVCAAVAKSGIALQFASESLREDEGVVRLAVAQNGYAIQYAAAHLKVDTAVVRTAAIASANATKLHCEIESMQEMTMTMIENAADKDCVSTFFAIRPSLRK
jgi:hypothetical protein